MNDALLFLTSTLPETTETTPPSYTNIEIYFWYIALVIMVIITIIFIKKEGGNKKKISSVLSVLTKQIKSLETIFTSSKLTQTKLKKVIFTIIHRLDSVDVTIIELKEKTRLDDLDKILHNKGEIVKELKETLSLSINDASKDLEVIKTKLISLKGQVELVVSLIK